MVIPEPIDFLIVTPMDDEQAAVHDALVGSGATAWELREPQTVENLGAKRYELPRRDRGGRPLVVITIRTKDAGRVHAALAVRVALLHWFPCFVLTVGIAGAAPGSKLKTGDVVVARWIVDYERKTVRAKAEPQFWQYATDDWLRDKIPTTEQCDIASLRELLRVTGRRRTIKVLKEGVVLSGDKKIRNTRVFRGLAKAWPKANSVEMEGAGVAAACKGDVALEVPHVMIRGVWDVIGKREPARAVKRRLACLSAASVAAQLLVKYPRASVLDEPQKLPAVIGPPLGPALRKAIKLYKDGYPVVLFGSSDDYVSLAQEFSITATGFVFWIKNGTPLEWSEKPDAGGRSLEEFDVLFQGIKSAKRRLVVFRGEPEARKYLKLRNELEAIKREGATPNGAHRRVDDFETSCGDTLRFSRLDWLPLRENGVSTLDGLDFGFVSWSSNFEAEGYCFCSRFLSRDLARRRRAGQGRGGEERCSAIWLFDVARRAKWQDSIKRASKMTWQALRFYELVVREVADALKSDGKEPAWVVNHPKLLLEAVKSGKG